MRTRHGHRGQSLAEFALIFPLFFFLVTGLFDLGRAIFAYSALNTAAREGTRYAIVQPKSTLEADIAAKVKSYYFGVKDLYDNSMVSVTRPFGTAEDPKVKIQISYTFNPITPGMKQILGAGKALLINVESIMRLAPVAK